MSSWLVGFVTGEATAESKSNQKTNGYDGYVFGSRFGFVPDRSYFQLLGCVCETLNEYWTMKINNDVTCRSLPFGSCGSNAIKSHSQTI
jgi:hypothetical protein